MTITTTVRLPEALKAEAETLAGALGISLNGLMAVALRDYLDRPVTRWSAGPSAELRVSVPPSSVPVTSAAPKTATQAGKGPKAKPPAKLKHRSGAAAFQRPLGPHGAAIVRAGGSGSGGGASS